MTKRQPRHPLEQLRLDRDWSYAQLSEAIYAVTGVRRSDVAWARICQHRAGARATTQAAIDRFLASIPKRRLQEASR